MWLRVKCVIHVLHVFWLMDYHSICEVGQQHCTLCFPCALFIFIYPFTSAVLKVPRFILPTLGRMKTSHGRPRRIRFLDFPFFLSLNVFDYGCNSWEKRRWSERIKIWEACKRHQKIRKSENRKKKKGFYKETKSKQKANRHTAIKAKSKIKIKI